MTGHASDIDAILSRRHDNGADYWATGDGRVYVGNPFSTIASLGMLHELGVGADHEAVAGGLELLVAAVRDDGRIRLAPKAPLYPCYTSEAARMLCRFGRTDAVERTVSYLLDNGHETGGWRCSFSRFGKGPETAFASPGATLYALDTLRFFTHLCDGNDVVDAAVDSLLSHWETREPIGPCHHGIGSRFMEIEFPFIRYNLFYWVYVLSFFPRATGDRRFTEALAEVESRLDEDGMVIVERPHRMLGRLEFCAKGRPSEVATSRYREVEANAA